MAWARWGNLNTNDWATYTPTWTGSSSNPAIGNGTIEGSYVKLGKFIAGRLRITAGSTTTFGGGDYSFGLPVTADGANTAYTPIGNGAAEDTGVALYAGFTYLSTSTAVRVQTPALNANWGKTVPFTFGSGDNFIINFFYEAA